MSFDSYTYVNETLDLIGKASGQYDDTSSKNYPYMLGYFQSHIKGVFDSLYATLTDEQKSILMMELDALKRRVEYNS
jgi:hypothetical protein